MTRSSENGGSGDVLVHLTLKLTAHRDQRETLGTLPLRTISSCKDLRFLFIPLLRAIVLVSKTTLAFSMSAERNIVDTAVSRSSVDNKGWRRSLIVCLLGRAHILSK